MPSISVRAWLRIRSPEEPLRAFVIEYNVEDIMHSATARALSNEIREDISSTDLLQVDIVSEIHVLRVNTEDLETASGVGDTDVDLAVEPIELTEDRVNRVGAVSRRGLVTESRRPFLGHTRERASERERERERMDGEDRKDPERLDGGRGGLQVKTAGGRCRSTRVHVTGASIGRVTSDDVIRLLHL